MFISPHPYSLASLFLAYTHFPFSTLAASVHTEPKVCLNPLGVGLLMSCFGICVIVICALLFYILSSKHKTKVVVERKPRQYDTPTSNSIYSTCSRLDSTASLQGVTATQSPSDSMRSRFVPFRSGKGSGGKWSLAEVLKRSTENC